MFELSVACKYLIPRRRQLSVSIISLVSTLVIALVVWLIVVFFSVKEGLENSWIEKITALTAPIRITPTEKYYHSYYYLVDSISANSHYATKTIGEKLLTKQTDPYEINSDEELPKEWQPPDLDEEGHVKDLVKIAFFSANSISAIDKLTVTDFETTVANLRLRFLRNMREMVAPSQQFLEHASMVGSFDADTPSMAKSLLPATVADFNNLLHMQTVSSDNIKEETPTMVHKLEENRLTDRLKDYFQTIEITSLKTPSQGWTPPQKLLLNTELQAAAIFKNDRILRIVIPSKANMLTALVEHLQNEGWTAEPMILKVDEEGNARSRINGQEPKGIPPHVPITLANNIEFAAQLIENSLNHAKSITNLLFHISGNIQGYSLNAQMPLGHLEIASAKIKKNSLNSLIATASPDGILMPSDMFGEPILLPKGFKDSGALIGDQGYLSYFSPTPSTIQEQRISVFVAGFYDPGIIPIGGKYILAGRNLTALIRASYNQENTFYSNGLNLRFNPITDAPKIKAELLQAFKKAGIAPYWHIETYQDYEFSKDIIQQLQSEKNLFSLISLVIIVVACSNIISMLIILVNDKKLEIGILRSMGASSKSIATIFGICGMVMGTIGSLVGILAALLTLRYVNELVDLMSRLQGHTLFNPLFYGNTLPTELSFEALMFVVVTTVIISLLAGVVPAFKACMMRPSATLRAE